MFIVTVRNLTSVRCGFERIPKGGIIFIFKQISIQWSQKNTLYNNLAKWWTDQALFGFIPSTFEINWQNKQLIKMGSSFHNKYIKISPNFTISIRLYIPTLNKPFSNRIIAAQMSSTIYYLKIHDNNFIIC